MKFVATTADAYRLLHDGACALARVEEAGIRIDVGLLDRTIEEVGRQIAALEKELKLDDFWRVWRKRFGDRANIGSRQQLGDVLCRELGVAGVETTPTGRVKATEEVLNRVDLPFVARFLELEKLKKLKSTSLEGVRREVVDGWLRPSFSLNLVRTYRSSSDTPNFQNLPVRDKNMGRLIRQCFVPRDGHVLVEIDYVQHEVRVSACYHHDPTMLRYIADANADLHREMACECYRLEMNQVSKEIRFCAKNQFVFPQFYGSHHGQCAVNLWNAVDAHQLKLADGMPLREHLRAQGLTELGDDRRQTKPGTFRDHIRLVEERFWNKRFPVYARWKRDWWEAYRRSGSFAMLTGFRISGVYGRNDVLNYPVQGTAFHILLWSLIRLVRWLEKRRARSVVVGQIHDSILADVCRDELDAFLAEAKRVMTEDVREYWKWIVVPLAIEVEVGERNWWDKVKTEV